MINSNVFNYLNVLNKAADASWLRNEAISNNIANVDTPGYKRQDVDFESALEVELKKSKYSTLDEKILNSNLKHLDVSTYTDSAGFSYRIDDNNVDIDTENVELASNQIKYNGLVDSMKQEISRLKLVIK
ncbi:flagellar basal body rod protein FlgB [Anaerosacchariphilus polymeriproducens]|uniref:Flagellar basal body rod protein FlgB n=1 Tax=Anaerosacchariphilus polymeriproducens TaxID=1812858 RepID=A0A371ASJ8_9FIRM|nr:flagellar basal body rod protein FlgB [Anaerosacchariphilus polymeriproducens]RDU22440.1 flagellar basal body rod protein FlgB [Anaerosacchariphilus polymeriproducens]